MTSPRIRLRNALRALLDACAEWWPLILVLLVIVVVLK